MTQRPRSLRRELVAVLALVLVAAIAAGGWIAGTKVRSPQAAAARAAAPEPSPITAPVERRVLAAQVVDRGDVTPGQAQEVNGPRFEDGATVTAVLVEVGDQLAEGNVVVEVSGRPVVVLEGSVPAFRAMRPGMLGTDVTQLQAALDRIGCDTSADDGVYGDATKECVATMYEALGYATVPTSATEATDLAKARDEQAEAQDALAKAERDLAKASAGPKQSELVAQEEAVAAARRKVEQAAAAAIAARAEAAAAVDAALLKLNAQLANAQSTPAQRAEAVAALDKAVLDLAKAEREAAEAVAAAGADLRTQEAKLAEMTTPADVETETLAVEQAEAAAARASEALASLEARSGATVPLGEVVFVDSLPATVSTLTARVGAQIGGSGGGGDDPASPLAVLATAGLRVEALVQPADADLLEDGMTVELRDEISGDTVEGRLVSLGEQVLSSEDGEDRGFPAVIEGVDELPREWTSRNVRVTFTGAATETEVLVVPVAALSSGADGEARVEVLDGATRRLVPVEAGLTAGGFVEIDPSTEGALEEGDLVVVGSPS